jgi:hypothetical protein
MIIRRSVPVVVSLGAALVLVVSGCSDDEPAATAPTGGSDTPSVTTVELTLDGQSVDLGDSVLKCYDHEGHLMVEAHNAEDPDGSHFLMDYYEDRVSLSVGVQDGDSYQYEQGKDGQTAEVTRDGTSVSVTGKIGGVTSGSGAPQPFSIDASCAKFFDTPPDSSKVDPSELPSIPSTCPPGQAVCIPEDK